jgi:hypothetical protein
LNSGGNREITVSQAAAACAYTVSPLNPASVAATGGTIEVSVDTTAGCEWSATESSPFISITAGGGTRSDDGKVTLTVAPNAGAARKDTVLVAGKTVSVTQDAGCTYNVSPLNPASVAAAGGTIVVSVDTAAGCEWSSSESSSFISITAGGGTRTGDGNVTLTVEANTAAARKDTVLVAGQTVNVTQDAGCNYTLSPQPLNLSFFEQTFNVTVTTGAQCAWQFDAAGSTLVTIDPAVTSGPGTKTMKFSVLFNLSKMDRQGKVRISTPTGPKELPLVQKHPTALITVSWTGPNGQAPLGDIDLHLIEPNGTWVHAGEGRRVGTSAYLEADNRPDRGGPIENMYVGAPLSGNYQVFIVHTGGGGSDTWSTITITLDWDTAPQSWTYKRTTTGENRELGYNVALVNIVTKTVTEITSPATRHVPWPR